MEGTDGSTELMEAALWNDPFLYMTDNWTPVTWFGEILPLWQNFINLWQIVKGLLSVWQNFEPTTAYFFKFLGNLLVL